MKMTIEEAILKCNEVAKNNEELMKRYDDASGYTRSHNESIRTIDAKKCEIRAGKYRQLAEWLKELKAIRETTPFCMHCGADMREEKEEEG